MSTGVGLIVLAVIFAFGVAFFTLAAITLLPSVVFTLDRVAELRKRRDGNRAEPG